MMSPRRPGNGRYGGDMTCRGLMKHRSLKPPRSVTKVSKHRRQPKSKHRRQLKSKPTFRNIRLTTQRHRALINIIQPPKHPTPPAAPDLGYCKLLLLAPRRPGGAPAAPLRLPAARPRGPVIAAVATPPRAAAVGPLLDAQRPDMPHRRRGERPVRVVKVQSRRLLRGGFHTAVGVSMATDVSSVSLLLLRLAPGLRGARSGVRRSRSGQESACLVVNVGCAWAVGAAAATVLRVLREDDGRSARGVAQRRGMISLRRTKQKQATRAIGTIMKSTVIPMWSLIIVRKGMQVIWMPD